MSTILPAKTWRLRLLRTRLTFSKSVMVSVGVPTIGNTELIGLIQVTQVQKLIRSSYYCDVLLSQNLLLARRFIAWETFTFFTGQCFCSSSAPQSACSICLDMCQLSFRSPNLKPVDNEVCGVLQRRVYRSRINGVLSKSGNTSTTESSSEFFDIGMFDCVRVFVKTIITFSTHTL